MHFRYYHCIPADTNAQLSAWLTAVRALDCSHSARSCAPPTDRMPQGSQCGSGECMQRPRVCLGTEALLLATEGPDHCSPPDAQTHTPLTTQRPHRVLLLESTLSRKKDAGTQQCIHAFEVVRCKWGSKVRCPATLLRRWPARWQHRRVTSKPECSAAA